MDEYTHEKHTSQGNVRTRESPFAVPVTLTSTLSLCGLKFPAFPSGPGKIAERISAIQTAVENGQLELTPRLMFGKTAFPTEMMSFGDVQPTGPKEPGKPGG